mgnify:CR=1 FL=1
MARSNTKARANTRSKKAKKTPLTHRAHAALKKHGALTSDALARKLGVKSKVASHAASQLKRKDRASFATRKGENYWRAKGKWPA